MYKLVLASIISLFASTATSKTIDLVFSSGGSDVTEIAALYGYSASDVSIATYDLEDNGSLEYFVRFDNTCSPNCFYTVLLRQDAGFQEILRGSFEQMKINEAPLGQISSILTDANTEYEWDARDRAFIPYYTGYKEYYEVFQWNEDPKVVEYYKSMFNSRNLSVLDGDLGSDGKPERLVVDYDEKNCIKHRYCMGYLFNSLSQKHVGEFIVGLLGRFRWLIMVEIMR